MAVSGIFVRGNVRVDLFNDRVCGGFRLSDGTVSRSRAVEELGNVRLMVCAMGDVFLFKTKTSREGDHMDCFNIARGFTLDWEVLMEEIRGQALLDLNLGVIFVAERLCALRDGMMEVPIADDVLEVCDDLRRRRHGR
ncbi:MAG: hypothetical protein RBR71_14380 [Gudongella sp.]|nr:hypothetical protein [Gudongella sp.]